jgi:hypothetical protein
VTAGLDRTVRLWNVASQQHVKISEIMTRSIAFAADGKTMAIGGQLSKAVHLWASGDTTVRLWQAPPLESVLREPGEVPSFPPVETIRPFWLALQGTAKATLAIDGRVHGVDVTVVDGTDWHAQFLRIFDHLREGATYKVRFRAKADVPRNVRLAAHIGQPDWHFIGLNEQVPLSVDWRNHEFEFKAKDLAADNLIIFNLGERTGTVSIADFSLTKDAN